MTVNNAENTKMNETSTGLQTFVLRFVVVTAILLIAIPTLPMLISNLLYSFSGASPKIYWYLSRASGFVTLTILWVSMALGLGITNKMARLWPGAPTAFAMHQFTSLLGLAFAAYHMLVLIGDHFVDFSLPRLIVPFSIAYETFWVGLGQLCFYLWIVTVVSFYFRQHIGQKVWRVIHYVNFAVYIMGFLHGLKSGTDSGDAWALWYFAISALSILLLLGYRVNGSIKKNKESVPKFAFPQFQTITERVKASVKALLGGSLKVPQILPFSEQAKKLIPKWRTESQLILERAEASPSATSALEVEDAMVALKEKSPIKSLERTIQGSKIRVHIFKEPTTRPIPELRNNAKSRQSTLLED
jgi:hypothetical protein